jgi:hypothetical protein
VEKQQAVNFLVQRGIDLYAIITSEGGNNSFHNNGGHHHGRLVPILFAGYMLQHAGMQNIASATTDASLYFGEDQYFYVAQSDIDSGDGGYQQSDLGMAEWGIRHGNQPDKDDRSWGASYRQCCTAKSTWAHSLTVMVLGLESGLRDESMLDYQSRYQQCELAQAGTNMTTSQFQYDMWDQHATTFRPAWSGTICP